MAKVITSSRIAKLAKQRENLKKQIENSRQKVNQYEADLAKELGRLALTHHLDQLTEEQLNNAFGALAKEHALL